MIYPSLQAHVFGSVPTTKLFAESHTHSLLSKTKWFSESHTHSSFSGTKWLSELQVHPADASVFHPNWHAVHTKGVPLHAVHFAWIVEHSIAKHSEWSALAWFDPQSSHAFVPSDAVLSVQAVHVPNPASENP